MREPPWEEIDELIRPLVRLLHSNKIEMLSSCQGGGHSEHATTLPTVNCLAHGRRNAQILSDWVVKVMLDAGWTGFTVEESCSRLYQGKPGPWQGSWKTQHRVVVTVWSLEGQPS